MRLPPLNALRAFEAAARHGSFVHAAQELHVTQGAVSRHVKLLEEHLNVVLFRRLPRGLELTAAAHRLLPKISASFEMIMDAANEATGATCELKVIAPATLANRWLMPRLARFKQLHAELQISVGLLRSSWDEFYRGSFDIAISCPGDDKIPTEMESVLIRRERLTPVCAPSLLEGGRPLKIPRDLKHHALLHPNPDPYDWRKWLDRTGLSGEIDYRKGQFYETMEMAIQAAVGGLGVTIADLYLVREELSAGSLVAPFDFVMGDDTGYSILCRRGRSAEPAVAAFRDWLISEAKKDEQDFASWRPASHSDPAIAVQ
ncbi:MAG: LysR substrate-binding domain-containing protein [Dongiaceae bacterium]